MKVTILGAGIAGLASALALTKFLPDTPDITIVELRSKPSNIGGAIGLTPNAVRALKSLGVLDVIRERNLGFNVDRIDLFNTYTGARLGQIDFTGDDGQGVGKPPLKELRIMRSDLMQALTEAVKALDNCKLVYGKTATKIEENQRDVVLTFDDGTDIKSDLLLGCDGIHSFTRASLVDPSRKPAYTGIAAVFGFTDIEEGQPTPWAQTGLCSSQRGTFMGSYFEPSKAKQFLAAIMETEDVKSREGWKALGSAQEQIKSNIRERYSSGVLASQLTPLIDKSGDWSLYPVYKLSPGGKWSSKRVILLGDAAHAMPPAGESAAIAMEDAILFARTLTATVQQSKPVETAFAAYEKLRRPSVDKLYAESAFGWDTQKDCGWFTFQIRVWFTSIFLWWTANARRVRYEEDVSAMELKLDF